MGKSRRKSIVVLLIGFLLGIYLGKFDLRGIKVPFPESQLVGSIGIYAGKSPFNLVSHPQVRNPVRTYREVTDVPSGGLAAPFMVAENGQWYLFMEVLNQRRKKGEIGLATSSHFGGHGPPYNLGKITGLRCPSGAWAQICVPKQELGNEMDCMQGGQR